MATKTQVGITTLMLLLASLGGYTLDGVLESNNLHYCEARDIYWICEGFTSYYSLENGKCINTQEGNKLCSSGWELVEITEDTPEFNVTDIMTTDFGIVPKPTYYQGDWCCSPKGCRPKVEECNE